MNASQEYGSPSIRRVQAYHAAHPCQAASLSLTRSRLRGQLLARLIEAEKTALFFRCWRPEWCSSGQSARLGSRTGMSPLSGLKDRPLIALVLEPHAIDDSHPDVGQGSDGHTVAFPLLAFSVVVVLRPPFLLLSLIHI